MNRGNFLKRMFALPFVVKAVANDEGLEKDKEGFYITKKEFEKEVRERENLKMQSPQMSNFVTISYMPRTYISVTTGY